MIKIVEQARGYESRGDRNRAVAALTKRGWNYFVFYRDVQSSFALYMGHAEWVSSGQIYVNR